MTTLAQKSCKQDQPKQHISAQLLCNLPQFPKINKTPPQQQQPHTNIKRQTKKEKPSEGERGKKIKNSTCWWCGDL